MTSLLGQAVLGFAVLGQVPPPTLPTTMGAPTVVIAIAPPPQAVVAGQAATPVPCDLGIGTDGDLLLTADGDLALVTGRQRVGQDVWMLAVTPAGSEYADPAYGSALAGLVGKRMPGDQTLAAYATHLQNQVIALHQKRATQGTPPGAGEAIASVVSTATKIGPGTVLAPLVVTVQQDSRAVVVPVPAS